MPVYYSGSATRKRLTRACKLLSLYLQKSAVDEVFLLQSYKALPVYFFVIFYLRLRGKSI